VRRKRAPIRCQAFELKMPDGSIVRGHGRFSGPMTDKDREAIAAMVEAMRKEKDSRK
jgi:hypothetical protein